MCGSEVGVGWWRWCAVWFGWLVLVVMMVVLVSCHLSLPATAFCCIHEWIVEFVDR